MQSSDNEHASDGTHPWLELQTKLRSAGLNIGYDTFKARWDSQQPDDQILHDLVDRFDGHGLVLKTNSGEQPEQGNPKKGSSGIEQMAKRATQKAFK